MDRSNFIDVAALEFKPFRFDTVLQPRMLDLSDPWTVLRPVRADGVATLSDHDGQRAIHVEGRIRASVAHACGRCLRGLREEVDSSFEVFLCPIEVLEEGSNVTIGHDEIEVGYYEGKGARIVDVVSEQLLLWLPVRSLCSTDCLGICPLCGTDRNVNSCTCKDSFVDPRWDALRQLYPRH